MKKLLAYLALALLLASCEEQADWNLQTGSNDFIVVDGIITNELKVQSITISKPVNFINDPAQLVSNATVLVSSNQVTYNFHESPSQPGTYLSNNAFTGIRNRTYSLLITIGNKVYSSKAILAPPVLLSEFDSVRFQKNADDSTYRIVWVANPYRPVKPAMYEILLDWSSAPGYENANADSCKAKLYYYTLPTLDINEVFAPPAQDISFPEGTVVIERRYSLTDDHATFIRALLLETAWQGGLFNTASANITTNLSQGAVGFFGACGVVEKTEVVK
jgi:hypothetical protein